MQQLVELNAPRLSPLVAYLAATRLSDPDLEMRHQVVLVLGELLTVDKEGRMADEMVRQYITTRRDDWYTIIFSLSEKLGKKSNQSRVFAMVARDLIDAGVSEKNPALIESGLSTTEGRCWASCSKAARRSGATKTPARGVDCIDCM